MITGGPFKEIIFGTRLFAWHLRVRPDRTIKAVEVSIEHPDDQDRVRALDAPTKPSPSVLAAGAAALRAAGMPLRQICKICGWFPRIADASVLIGLYENDPALLQKLDRGSITMGHAHVLLPLPVQDRERWAGNVIAHRLSVSALVSAIARKRNPATISSDIQRIQTTLGDRLGAPIEITWNDATGASTVALRWFTAADLLGVLAKLSQAPYPESHALPNEAREIRFRISSLDEFDALFGHLLAEP